MYVDYKITTWKRVHFEDNVDSERIVEIIKEEGINEIFDEDLGFTEQETLLGVDEEMTVEENNGSPTVKVYVQDKSVDKLIWNNGKRLDVKTEVKIKQLKWVNRFESSDEFGIKAQTPFCTYTIIDMKGTRFAKGIHLSSTEGVDVEVSSFDEGKKLAQADFERRIKECLIIE